jgi:hypothetical protein
MLIFSEYRAICSCLLSITAGVCAAFSPSARAASVDFARDVLPILSDACFNCHGPDEKGRKADLRLDQKEGAFRTEEGVTVIAPGDLERSELVVRITSTDKDETMPPPKAIRQLKPAEVDILKRWVKEGAPWGVHWAFAPMQKVSASPAPSVTAQNEIDALVHVALAKEGLKPAPEAERERLLRRVTLDLTGLPPTPAEIAAFRDNADPAAYERVVDRLLASPKFGERIATEWLDLARYADTHGYQMDRPRAMWAWRDWVIRAFNENLPFDQFVTWQLAGDLLPNPTKDQRLATAFNRLHCQNEEGGVVEEEYRVAYVVDRVNTFGTAFLGMTFECARCHDHRYDPITQRDYYQLFSFFQNIDEAGQISYKGFSDVMPAPTMLLSTDEQDRELATLQAETARLETELEAGKESARDGFHWWLAHNAAVPAQLPGLVGSYDFDDSKNGEVPNAADPPKGGKLHESPKLVDGRSGSAAELDGENGFTFPGVGHFKRTDPFTLSLWIRAPEHTARQVVVHHSKAPADAASRGYELLLEDGRVSFGLHYQWPAGSVKVTTKHAIPRNEWVHVTATYDGSSKAAGARIYVNGELAAADVIRDGLYKDIAYDNGEPDLAIGYRFRDSGFKGGQVDEFRVFDRAITSLEALQLAGKPGLFESWAKPVSQLSSGDREGLYEYYLAAVDAPRREKMLALKAVRQKQSALVNSIAEVMVMQELPQPKPAFVLQRGAYDARGAAVTANTPAALPPFPPDFPRNRLGLARWLLDPEHPLLARVTVNRFWQIMFGRGLVETSDNFGMQGATPSHPELLDWLARRFIASGWNVKETLKTIAMSGAYRQSSKASPELLARDPQNHFLARGPARRLTAEMLRDQALATSGLLVEKIGGPSVKPYQPAGLWEEIAMGKPKYEQSKGEGLYRRSLYTFWKRTVPPPTMITFDAGERNVCAASRQSTSTPLQALAMLNDVQVVEAARFIGQRMLKEGGTLRDEQLRWVFRLVTSRDASDREIGVLAELFEEQREIYSIDCLGAEEIRAVGEAKAEDAIPPADLAAATVLAKALLNFDEALMRR